MPEGTSEFDLLSLSLSSFLPSFLSPFLPSFTFLHPEFPHKLLPLSSSRPPSLPRSSLTPSLPLSLPPSELPPSVIQRSSLPDPTHPHPELPRSLHASHHPHLHPPSHPLTPSLTLSLTPSFSRSSLTPFLTQNPLLPTFNPGPRYNGDSKKKNVLDE